MLQDLDYKIIHRKGSANKNADGLSRNPLPSTRPYNETPLEGLYDAPPPIVCTATKIAEEPKLAETPPARPAYFPPADLTASTPHDWARLQRSDANCQRAMAAMQKKHTRFDVDRHNVLHRIGCNESDNRMGKTELGSDGPLWDKAAKRRKAHTRLGSRLSMRRVVPDSLKAFVLRRYHGLPLSGHNGWRRVYAEITKRYWWKGMAADVKKWVRACDQCARRKTPRPAKTGEPGSILAQHPGHSVCIDIQGPLPETASGNKYLLTVLDCFTRWPMAIPIPSHDAKTVATALFRHYLCVHGCPSRVLSDRGREFVARGFKAMCSKWGTTPVTTSGHQPQSVPVERFHRYLNSAMTMLHGKFGHDWDTYVDAALFTYRVSINETTGFSPYQLTFGRDPPMPDDVLFADDPSEFETEEEYGIYVNSTLASAYDHAFRNQLAAAEKNAMTRAERAHTTTFFPGQQVFYWQSLSAQGTSASEADEKSRKYTVPSKWNYKWSGPHKVVRQAEGKPNIYEIALARTGKIISANVNRLAPFHPWSDELPSTAEPEATELSYRTGGKVEPGSLFIIALSEESSEPFGVCKLLERNAKGHFKFQWLSNYKGDVLGTYNEGWRDTRDNKITWTAPRGSAKKRYVPLTGEDYTDEIISDSDVIVHSFQLTSRKKLPQDVLKALSDDPYISWQVKPE